MLANAQLYETEIKRLSMKIWYDPDFIYYLVCSDLVREPAIKSMVGSSGRQRVQTDVVQHLEIAVPSLDAQIKIGAFLKSIDDKIAINTEINNNLAA